MYSILESYKVKPDQAFKSNLTEVRFLQRQENLGLEHIKEVVAGQGKPEALIRADSHQRSF